MASNPFFNNFTNANEQRLYDDIAVEMIRMHAHDMYYLPRTGVRKDDIINEYEMVRFDLAIPVELYIKNVDAFEGDGKLMSKFGLSIRDQMTLVISRRTFEENVQNQIGSLRPNEGDIVYVPMLKTAYEIKYVSSDAIFYTFGSLNSYQLTLELFENQGEVFATGIPEIDDKYTGLGNASKDVGYDIDLHDADADNDPIQQSGDEFLDFSEISPFGAE